MRYLKKSKKRYGIETIIVALFVENNAKISEAIAALQVLGYNKKEIEKAFEKLEKEQLTTEELIRKGLMFLGR